MLQSYIIIDPKTEITAKPSANRFIAAVPIDKKEIPIALVRQLITWAGQRGFEAGLKVGIILEAQQLSLVAQQSLLKLLEEPVVDTELVLTVDSVSTILPTIRSRCAMVQLNSLEANKLERWGLQRQAVEAKSSELPLADLLRLSPWQRIAKVAPLWQAKDASKIAVQIEAWRREVPALMESQPQQMHLWLGLAEELEQASVALGRYASAKLVLSGIVSKMNQLTHAAATA